MASGDTPKTILLRGHPTSIEALAAAGTIKPGMLIKYDSSGEFALHDAAAAQCAAIFAREPEYVGGNIDDAYDEGDNVVAWHCKPGDMIYAWLAQGQDVTIGTLLESDGQGALRDVATSGVAIARAVEAVDNNPGTGIARIKVEVI